MGGVDLLGGGCGEGEPEGVGVEDSDSGTARPGLVVGAEGREEPFGVESGEGGLQPDAEAAVVELHLLEEGVVAAVHPGLDLLEVALQLQARGQAGVAAGGSPGQYVLELDALRGVGGILSG